MKVFISIKYGVINVTPDIDNSCIYFCNTEFPELNGALVFKGTLEGRRNLVDVMNAITFQNARLFFDRQFN